MVIGIALVGCRHGVRKEVVGSELSISAPVPGSAPVPPPTLTRHPRLWIREDDLASLRARATDANPFWQALREVASVAQREMDAGRVPSDKAKCLDAAGIWPCEAYAMLFAFMSLVDAPPRRPDWTARARTLLMLIVDEAAKGRADAHPLRKGGFSVEDRSRWYGESFALTVDWIYPALTARDKASIRKVFLRWADELSQAEVTDFNHPEPMGKLNDPALLQDKIAVRYAGNNYYSAHARNLGLMSLALDPADDPDGQLRRYLASVMGAWLYVQDHLFRNDARGGLGPDGSEYGPQTLAYLAQLLLALSTSGEDDPARWGPQAALAKDRFWDDAIVAYVHSMSPSTWTHPWLGEVRSPAWYGDGQDYVPADPIDLFAPIGLLGARIGKVDRLSGVRWIETNLGNGGRSQFVTRARKADQLRQTLLYFMLFDTADPHDARPVTDTTYFAPGLGKFFGRTSWSPDATWFDWSCGWISIDHQHGDANAFELFRKGEWLTKERTGYGSEAENISCSDSHNTLSIENGRPDHYTEGYRRTIWRRGSQYLFRTPKGDGRVLAHSATSSYLYGLGDATDLYDSTHEGALDVVHGSRSIVWLKPDIVVVYDRATTKTAGRFKRFWLQLPHEATLSGRRVTMTTPKNQQLVVTSLLPENAMVDVARVERLPDEPADNDPITHRIRIDATGRPADVRFLSVLQAGDRGATPDATAVVDSADGAFAGAVVGKTVFFFPKNLGAPREITYALPAGVVGHVVTGLEPNVPYSIALEGGIVKVRRGEGRKSDEGGVLAWGIGGEP
jgi:hypothetical protein